MRKYWEIMKSQIKIDTAYSIWFWAGAFASVLQLLIIYAFWHAVYENRLTIAGMPLDVMITYVAIALLLSEYVSGVGNQLSSNIRDGSVAIELLRPYDYLTKLVSVDLGIKLSASFRNTIPMVIIAFIFLKINFPKTVEAGLLFAVSIIIGILLGAFFDLIVGVVAFWTINIWGLRVLRSAILTFFSGSLIPISLFPEWLRTISHLLPFQSMIYIPVSIYTGTLNGSDAYLAIAVQLLWLLILFLLVRFVWSRALRKVTIFGG